MSNLKRFIPRSVAVSVAPISDRIIDFACSIGLIKDPQIMTIAGTTARYRVTSASERWRVQQYMGEKNILEAMISDIGEGDCFWDVGAAVGTYSCLAASAGAVVVAFEPHGQNHDRCLENAQLNGFSIDVNQVALSDTSGELSLKEDRTVGSGMHRISDTGTVKIPTIRGDEVSAPDPDIIKIDVEGHELNVLRGLGSRLETVQKIWVECHPNLGATKEDVTEYLNSMGFSVTTYDIERSEPYIYATNDRFQ